MQESFYQVYIQVSNTFFGPSEVSAQMLFIRNILELQELQPFNIGGDVEPSLSLLADQHISLTGPTSLFEVWHILVDKAEWLGHELWFGEVLKGDW